MPMGWVAAATAASALLGAEAASNAADTQASAARSAADTQAAAARYGTDVQKQIFDLQNEQQRPYREAGYSALSDIASLKPYLTEKYNTQFGPKEFAEGIDPGYAWRLQQGQMANQRQSNIGGGALSGNTLAGLQAYTQGEASQEFQNAYNRFNTDFNRKQVQRTNIYNTLAGIAGIGQTAANQTGQAASAYGANVANLAGNAAAAQAAGYTGAAGAQAAGAVGQANAYGNALQGLGNQMYLNSLRNNQSLGYTPTTSYSSGANYDLTAGQNTGGQSLRLKT